MADTCVTNVTFDGYVIRTTVTSSGAAVRDWIDEVLSIHRRRLDRLVVGLDAEWRPNFQRGGDPHPVALLQLCVGHRCLVFQLLHADYVPAALEDFLADATFRFAGAGIAGDAARLSEEYDLVVANAVDLAELAAEVLRRPELERAGLKALVSEVMGARLEKPRHVQLGRWDALDLSWEQIDYACIDAFVSFEVARRLLSGE